MATVNKAVKIYVEFLLKGNIPFLIIGSCCYNI